jgi:formate hydrogenlyase subunit 6/NADH:ubiquinone oxidoreductase subunit I
MGHQNRRCGKHILCEKPLTMNYPEAMAVVEAAVRNDVFLMEALCIAAIRRRLSWLN